MSDCLRELQRRSVSARHPGAEPFYSRRGQPVQAVLTHTRTSCLPSVLVPAGHDRRSSVKFSARDAEGAQNSNKNTLQEAVVETVTSFLQDNAAELLQPVEGSDPAERRSEDGATESRAEGEQPPGYQPKVQTWGVFPRPQNISATFGGGRTWKPGDLRESKEEAAKRDAEVARLLAEFRQARGLDRTDSEADLQEAQSLLDAGNDLMQAGRLRLAEMKLNEAVRLVSSMSKVGGEACLQWAICVDSQGRPEEAKRAYRTIRTHPQEHVARKAKQMLFGFEAQDILGAEQFHFGVRKGEYDSYLTRLSNVESWNNSFFGGSGGGGGYAAVGSSEGVKKSSGIDAQSLVVAGGVLSMPFLLILGILGSRALGA